MPAASGLKILRVMARLNTGGPSRHVILLDAGLRARGHRTLLVHGEVSPSEASMEPLAAAADLPRLKLPFLGRSLRFVDDVRACAALLRLLFEQQPDVLHTHTSKAGMVGRAAAAVYNATRGHSPRRRRCVVVHTFHGHVFDEYFSPGVTQVVLAIERALARCCDRIITISARQRDDIVEHYRVAAAARVSVIPLGLDLTSLLLAPPSADRLRAALGIPPHAFVVGFVGRLVPIKDPITMVRALAHARATLPDIHLVIAGDGQLRQPLLAEARALGVSDHVHSLGWWANPLEQLYPAMDVCALSSLNEGTPVALIEAMAAARPVVATAVGGVPDLVTDGVNGRLVPPRDPVSLGNVLVELARDSTQRRALGDAGRRLAAARYDHERLVDDVERLYRELTGILPATE